jgi:hypothetical protein
MGDDAPATADHVAVAHDGEPGIGRAGIGVAIDEELVADQLRRAIQVDRAARLVGRQRDDALDSAVNRGVDDVLRTVDIRLDRLEWVVLGGRHLLEGRGVDDEVDAMERAVKSVAIADVTDEEPQAPFVGVALLHLELLQLVPTEDDDPSDVRLLEDGAHEAFAKGARPARDEDGSAVEDAHGRADSYRRDPRSTPRG